MKLTIKKETEETINIDLSTPIYRKQYGAYVKFYEKDGKAFAISAFSTGLIVNDIGERNLSLLQSTDEETFSNEREFNTACKYFITSYNL